MTGFMNDSGFALSDLRKLAGLPNDIEDGVPADTSAVEFDDPEMAAADFDSDFDSEMAGGMDAPADMPLDPSAELDLPSPMDSPALGAPMEPVVSPWEDTLAQLEKQLSDIPVGDFKAVIDSLHRVANYAEDIRRSLVTEGKRSFRDYIAEVELGDTTLGNNVNDAIKAIHTRMGGKPQDQQKARQTFDALRKTGAIKPKGAGFTMQTLDDQQFNDAISAPTVP